jgi:3'(2'), 5'-bisphosphate nucleotidase
MKNSRNIQTALKAAKEASEAILAIYHSNIWDIEYKKDNSPLTLADKKAHQVISDCLQSTGLPILSEEGKTISDEVRRHWEYFWLVDPLDGTKEFLNKNGEFTVNIALIYNSQPVWGVVSAPAHHTTWFMDEENKVFRKNDSGIVKQLFPRKSPLDLMCDGLKVVASRSHIDNKTNLFLQQLNNPITVSMGSSLKFMMIAEQKADIYPRFAPTSEWDTAASHAILNALGYKVFKEGSESEIEYNKKELLNPGFIVK